MAAAALFSAFAANAVAYTPPPAPSGLQCKVTAGGTVVSWSSSDAANLYDIEFATSELEPAYMSITAPNTTITWATSPGETSPNWVTVRAHSAAAGKEQMIIGWSTFARRVNCMNTELHTSSQTRQLLPPPRRVGGLQHDSISIHWTPSPTTHGRGRSLCHVHYQLVVAGGAGNEVRQISVAQATTVLSGLEQASTYKVWVSCSDGDGTATVAAASSAFSMMRTGRDDTTWHEVFRVAENMQVCFLHN